MSTAEHPQTDGQSEAAVKVIQKLLHPFVFQDQDWEVLLPSLEFAYNDTQHATTGETPFRLNVGYHPSGPNRIDETNNPHVDDRIHYLERLQEAAKDAINDAQLVQQRHANAHRDSAPKYKVGDWVLLKRKESQKRKLAPLADGPFLITKTGTNTVTLKFPKKSRVHPTVNVSRVQMYFGPRPELLTAPPDDDTNHEYLVDRILGHKVVNGKDFYYVHWKGYPADDDTWEPKENLNELAIRSWKERIKTRSSIKRRNEGHGRARNQ
jgi:hypothetical protein